MPCEAFGCRLRTHVAKHSPGSPKAAEAWSAEGWTVCDMRFRCPCAPLPPPTTCVCAVRMCTRDGASARTDSRARPCPMCVCGRRQGAVRGADEVPHLAQGDGAASPGHPAAHASHAHGSRDNKRSGRRAVRLRRVVRLRALMCVFPLPRRLFRRLHAESGARARRGPSFVLQVVLARCCRAMMVQECLNLLRNVPSEQSLGRAVVF